jgi:hypothetical protein
MSSNAKKVAKAKAKKRPRTSDEGAKAQEIKAGGKAAKSGGGKTGGKAGAKSGGGKGGGKASAKGGGKKKKVKDTRKREKVRCECSSCGPDGKEVARTTALYHRNKDNGVMEKFKGMNDVDRRALAIPFGGKGFVLYVQMGHVQLGVCVCVCVCVYICTVV